MQIGAIHHIRDREAWDRVFFAAAADLSQLPEGVTLISSVTSSDVTKAICVWDAPDAEQVQAFLDEMFGDSADNEAFAVDPQRSLGVSAPTAAQG